MRLYDHLFRKEDPDDVPEGSDWLANINPNSLERLCECRVEPYLAQAKAGNHFQFERLGYFCVDDNEVHPGRLVFNRSVSLRDSWAKLDRAKSSSKPS